MPVNRLWSFLDELRQSGEATNLHIPEARPVEDELVKTEAREALRSHKGAGWAARLLESCSVAELPASIKEFLTVVYQQFPRSAEPELVDATPAPEHTGAAPAAA